MRDTERITSVFIALRGNLARAVRHIVPPKEIEDIVQETYIRVCKADGEKRIKSPQSFMYKTARNLALDYAKRSETRLADSLADTENEGLSASHLLEDGTLNQASSEQEFSQFCRAVRYLPVQCRRAFVLRKVYGYSQQEIAKVMQISERTVEKHIATGIKRCMYMLEQQAAQMRPSAAPDDVRGAEKLRKGNRA